MPGSHGSLSKAGKVKWQGGKPAFLGTELSKKHKKKHSSPIRRNKRNYRMREVLHRNAGQNYIY